MTGSSRSTTTCGSTCRRCRISARASRSDTWCITRAAGDRLRARRAGRLPPDASRLRHGRRRRGLFDAWRSGALGRQLPAESGRRSAGGRDGARARRAQRRDARRVRDGARRRPLPGRADGGTRRGVRRAIGPRSCASPRTTSRSRSCATGPDGDAAFIAHRIADAGLGDRFPEPSPLDGVAIDPALCRGTKARTGTARSTPSWTSRCATARSARARGAARHPGPPARKPRLPAIPARRRCGSWPTTERGDWISTAAGDSLYSSRARRRRRPRRRRTARSGDSAAGPARSCRRPARPAASGVWCSIGNPTEGGVSCETCAGC